MPLPAGEHVQLQAVASTTDAGARVFMTPAVGARRRAGALPADARDEIASALDETC